MSPAGTGRLSHPFGKLFPSFGPWGGGLVFSKVRLCPLVPDGSRSPLDQSSTRLILGSVFCLVAVFRPVATANRRPPSEHGRRTDDSIAPQAQEPGETVLYFPDYVDGGGWSVQLVLSNVGTMAATAVVEVYGQDGHSVTDLFDFGSRLEIPSLGSRVLRSTGGGAIRCGWIQVRPDTDSVSGLLTYRHTQTGIEVGVQPIEPGSQFTLSVEETSEIGTGLAIFKPETPSEIEFRIRNEEGIDPIGETLISGDFQQNARTLPEWFENVDTRFLRDFRGLLFLRSTDGSDFAPVGLRFGKQKGSLSAVPVIPIRDAGAGKMYWTDSVLVEFGQSGSDKIQRANLNGSQVEDLVITERASVGGPGGIALGIGN